MTTKICSVCKIDKPLNEFRINLLGKYGRHSICIECQRLYAKNRMAQKRITEPDKVKEIKRKSDEKHHDEILERQKKHYQEHKPEILQKAANYREEHRKEINQWHRDYRLAHPEIRKEKDRQSYQNHKEERAEKYKIYREEHKAETRQRNRARKVAIKYSTQDFNQSDWIACLNYWGQRCAICGRSASDDGSLIISADHWIPLKKGGLTTPKNIIPLCHGIDGCNNKKHDQDPMEWLKSFLCNTQAIQKMAEIQAYFNHL
jgi:hypothetical protein